MAKFLTIILAMMTFAFNAIAGEPTTNTSTSQDIKLEIAQYNGTSGHHRAPMSIKIEAFYNADNKIIEVSCDGEVEGKVFLYLNENIIEYDSNLNTSLPIPSTSGLYRIEIIGDNWIAYGTILL